MASWLGLSFELLCFNHSSEIATALGFSAVRYQAGPYFKQKANGELTGVQLDLVFKREDKVFTVCEVKYQSGTVGLDAAKQLDKAIASVGEFKNKTVQKVLISGGAVSRNLEDGIHFSKVLTSEDICKMD